MKRRLSIGSLLIAGALMGFTGHAGASTQSDSGVGMGETSQQNSQQGVGLEGSDSSSVILGGPEILFGRIEKVEDNGFVVQGDHGQFMKLQMSKDTNIVCSSDPNRQQAEYETHAPSRDPSTLKGVVGSTDEAANKDLAHGSGFVVGSPACNFRPGDLVRIEASDMGTMTTITRLPYETNETTSQIATEKDEDLSTSAQ